MKLVAAHMRAQTLELFRYPAFSVPTLLFPTLLFVLFGIPQANGDAGAVAAGFAAVAVLGVAFFQFGVGIAAERASPWEAFLRTLPVSAAVRFAARVLAALVFAAASATLLLLVAVGTTAFSLAPGRWLALAAALVVGAIPFALFGIALGYWARPKAALPLANLLFLPLSFLGGLWSGPGRLPGDLEEISRVLPTRQWGEIGWVAVGTGTLQLAPLLALTGYALVFGGAALWGYRRDEGERYA